MQMRSAKRSGCRCGVIAEQGRRASAAWKHNTHERRFKEPLLTFSPFQHLFSLTDAKQHLNMAVSRCPPNSRRPCRPLRPCACPVSCRESRGAS